MSGSASTNSAPSPAAFPGQRSENSSPTKPRNGRRLSGSPARRWTNGSRLHFADRPRQRFVAAENHDVAAVDRNRSRHRHRVPLELDRAGVGRQAVEIRAIQRGEFFQPIERALLVEYLRIGLQRGGADEYAGTTTGGLLEARQMWRRVGADEEAGFAGCRGAAQREAMMFALGDRQAIIMWPQP